MFLNVNILKLKYLINLLLIILVMVTLISCQAYSSKETVYSDDDKFEIEKENKENQEVDRNVDEDVAEDNSKASNKNDFYIPVSKRAALVPKLNRNTQIIKIFQDDTIIDDYPVIEWKDETEVSHMLPVQFGEIEGSFYVKRGHPNGTFMIIEINENQIYLNWDLFNDSGQSPFDDLGFLNTNYSVQATAYDFNKDGYDEIVIAVTDQAMGGLFNVFSYTHVEDYNKINPFVLELKEYVQIQLWLDGNKLVAPIGSKGDSFSYLFTDDGFYKK